MTDKVFHIGGVGPFEFDADREYVTDVDPENPAGSLYEITEDAPADATKMRALRTNSQVLIESAPSQAGEVVRLEDLQGAVQAVQVADIDDPAAELAGLSGTVAGALLLAWEASVNQDLFTLYAWDTEVATGANGSYVVAGDGGFWIAISGRYTLGDVIAQGDIILNAGKKLIFNGIGGDTYFVYEDGQLRLYKGGELVSSW
ncbi:hypothetical protein LLG95_10645 [bacterium]|nr:hypothetical protein [bacterium]